MKARIKATGEVCDVLSVFLDKKNGRYGFFSPDEIEVIPDEPETISDGHGNTWLKKCSECNQDTMEIVRPGEAICPECFEKYLARVNDEILANDGMKPDKHELESAVNEMMVNFGLEKGNHSNPVDRERDK